MTNLTVIGMDNFLGEPVFVCDINETNKDKFKLGTEVFAIDQYNNCYAGFMDVFLKDCSYMVIKLKQYKDRPIGFDDSDTEIIKINLNIATEHFTKISCPLHNRNVYIDADYITKYYLNHAFVPCIKKLYENSIDCTINPYTYVWSKAKKQRRLDVVFVDDKDDLYLWKVSPNKYCSFLDGSNKYKNINMELIRTKCSFIRNITRVSNFNNNRGWLIELNNRFSIDLVTMKMIVEFMKSTMNLKINKKKSILKKLKIKNIEKPEFIFLSE